MLRLWGAHNRVIGRSRTGVYVLFTDLQVQFRISNQGNDRNQRVLNLNRSADLDRLVPA